MENKGKSFIDTFYALNKRIDDTLNEIYESLCDMCKANGGYVKTPACSDKPILYAFYEDYDERTKRIQIHGLRYDDELGLCICTDEMLDNYQFDTKYYFEKFYDFSDDDLEELNKVLEDAAYYVEFDMYDLLRTPTLMSIVGGISDYLV